MDNVNQTYKPGILLQKSSGEEVKSIFCKFAPHAVYANPVRPHELLFFDKAKRISGATNLQDPESVITYIHATGDHQFYGHGQFLPDGASYLATERATDYRGKIVLRDSKTHQILREYPLAGLGPHDCVLINDHKVLAVAVSGILGEEGMGEITGDGEVVFLELESGKILDSMKPDRKDHAPGHLSISSRGHIAVLLATDDNAPNPSGFLAIGKVGGTLKTLYGPRELHKRESVFTLSPLIDEDHKRVLTTNTRASVVSCWDLETGEYITHFDIPSPVGIVISEDKNFYLVSAGMDFLFKIDVHTLKLTDIYSNINQGRYQAHTLPLLNSL